MTPADLQIPEREGAPVVDGDHPDAELIARVAEFYPALEKHNIAAEAWATRRTEADAMPDCPPRMPSPLTTRRHMTAGTPL